MLTKPKPGFRINYAHPLSRGLVGWWLMNEGGGPTAFDYSGNGNHGTLTNGPVWSGSPLGGALDFDGGDDYVNAPASFPITADMTVAAWIKRTGNGNNTHFVNYASDSQNRISLVVGGSLDNDALAFLIEYQDTAFRIEDLDANPINKWQHVVGVFSGGNTLKLYADGIDINASSVSGFAIVSVGNVRIGGDSVSSTDGLIDDVRIYNRALSATEIQQLYSNPYSLVLRQNTAQTQFNGAIIGPTPGHGYQHQSLSLSQIGFKRSWSN